MIQYPSQLPPPTRDGFGYSPVSPMLRSDLVSGRARQRRKYTSVPTMASVRWVFNDVQAMAFEAWFNDALVSGSEWFECPLVTPETGDTLKTYTARFTDIYDGPSMFTVSLWSFTATLELRERPILIPGWGLFPDYIASMNLIDLALNQEWPEA